MAGDGSSSGFSGAEFRDAIRFAMTMGAPVKPEEQVTFLVPAQETYTYEDPAGDPYDWTSTPTVTATAQTVRVPVAAVYAAGAPSGEAVGIFDTSRVTLTILDEDWATVLAGASGDVDEFILGGVHYIIDPPGAVPVGLFDVTVYTLQASARG